MNLVVVGMGYVGIPTAALFADVPDINVTGIQRKSDRSGWKIDYLNQGKSPIKGDEPNLEELIKSVVSRKKLKVTDEINIYADADVILIDVQTPINKDRIPKYESLKSVSLEIGEKMKKGVMVGIESTVAPGTTENVVKPLIEKTSGLTAGKDFNLIFSYERVMVGRLLHNLQNMPRIVGGFTRECAERGSKLYKKITKSDVYITDCLTAEVSKTVENAYRDVNIAFANEIAMICESLGIDVYEVKKYVNSLPYDPSEHGKNPFRMMMTPGAGVGGHCLPKDSWLLKYGVDTYGSYKVKPNILVESRKTNDFMPEHMRLLIQEAFDERKKNFENSKITILGYAFLENSDDTRNTPARALYDSIKKKADVIVHDPYVKDFNGAKYTKDIEEALIDSDCLVLVTKHKEYYEIDLNWLKTKMNTPVIVDGRNVFNYNEAKNLGFTYRGVGIGKK